MNEDLKVGTIIRDVHPWLLSKDHYGTAVDTYVVLAEVVKWSHEPTRTWDDLWTGRDVLLECREQRFLVTSFHRAIDDQDDGLPPTRVLTDRAIFEDWIARGSVTIVGQLTRPFVDVLTKALENDAGDITDLQLPESFRDEPQEGLVQIPYGSCDIVFLRGW